MRVKLRDVADEAGVSIATASLVLNGKDGEIGPDAKARVLAATDKLGYRPNALAKGLRSQKTRTIGFFSHQVLTTPYAAAMVQGAQEAADRAGYVLLLANVSDDPTRTSTSIETLLDRQIDAAIYATMYHQAITLPEKLNNTKTVLLNAFPSGTTVGAEADHWSVVPDEHEGATAAIEALVKSGHTRITMINDAARTIAALRREEAFLDCMALHKLAVGQNSVVEVPGNGSPTLRIMTKLLNDDDRPTALFCYNDRIAAQAYHACNQLGLRIPQELSIIGFDNQELVAEAIFPPLTTVQLPHYEMGKWAMEKAMSLLNESQSNAVTAPDEQAGPSIHLMACPLVERQSVASPQ